MGRRRPAPRLVRGGLVGGRTIPTRRRRLRRSTRARSASVARGARLLPLLVAVAGCAITTPRPAPPPPGAALVPPPIISGFGDWTGEGGGPRPWQHAGVDIRAAVGTPVLAAADGTVLRVGQQRYAGRLIVVGHAGELATVYFHLSRIDVRPGQTVQRGEPIGRSGETGNATTPHLHFGVCHREAAACGPGIDSGWADPAAYWVRGDPCFAPGQDRAAEPLRFTFPLPCRPA